MEPTTPAPVSPSVSHRTHPVAPTQPRPFTLATPDALASWVTESLRAHTHLLDALCAESEPRTLENTLRRYDDAIALLAATGSQLSLLNSTHPLQPMRDMAQAQLQNVSQVGVELALNQDVFRALSQVSLSGTDAATRHYLERTLLGYRLAGVDRDEATRNQLKALQDQATQLSLTFSRNVQESIGTVIITDVAELAGLPPDFIAGHPVQAEGEHAGSIVLTTNFPDYLPVMTFARSHSLRQRMLLAYQTRAYPQNVQVLADLLRLRHEIATLLGFSTWADLAMADQMMESSANLEGFLNELDRATLAGAQREYATLLAFAQKTAGDAGEPIPEAIDAASRGFWLEQFRRSHYAFDSQSVRPYFPYDRVQAGVLSLVEQIFHVRFAPVSDAETWHPSVTTWDVYDARGNSAGHQATSTQNATDSVTNSAPNSAPDSAPATGTPLGRFYLDMHPREGKDKWFSAAPLIPGIVGRQLPEAALICNFAGGSVGGTAAHGTALTGSPQQTNPGLLQHSDVSTFLHEFGHLMHAILGGHQAWAGLSGIATEGDFVEVPSQMLEEFIHDPALLARFAHHYQSGEPIPAPLVHSMNRAGAFGRADSIRTQLFYTTYSLDTHRLPPGQLAPDLGDSGKADKTLDALLQEDYRRFLPYTWVDGNRLYASFTHLIGYSSNYYTYMYDKVIALDFFAQFGHGDLLAEAVTTRYREQVLAPGGSRPGKELVRAFLGRDQSPAAFTAWLQQALEPQPDSPLQPTPATA
jgi:thimet oligopeptidase